MNVKKALITLATFIAMGVTLTGCAVGLATIESPVGFGAVYTNVKGGVQATSNEVGTKVGSSDALNVLGLAAIGDASITSAANKAGIERISHVDYETTSFLGLFVKYEIYVYGE